MATKKTYKKIGRQTKKLRKNFSRYSNLKKALFFAVIFAIAGGGFLIVSQAYSSPYDDVKQASLVDNPKRGLVYKGLKAIKANANHPCKGIFEFAEVKDNNGKPLCTHGPDPAPEDVDITRVSPEQRLKHLEKQPKDWATQAQLQTLDNPSDQIANDATLGAFTNPYPLSPVPCTSGSKRIQLVLISNIPPNNYTSLARTLLRQAAYRMESQLQISSLNSGSGSTNRHFRFVTNSSCEPTISTLIAPTSVSLANHVNVIAYLKNHGYNAPSTRYLVWDYANNVNFCAVGNVLGDSSPNGNLKETSSLYSIIGPSCWSSEAEIHEIMHNLGAVHNDAPHTTSQGHCLDGHDAMCYPDHKDPITNQLAPCKASNGTTFPCGANGKPVYVAANCSNEGFRWLLDCNKNDYFNTGTISPTNYLYNHWNVARSPYLQR